MPTKSELRRKFRALRNALPQAQVDAESERIRGRMMQLPEVARAKSVFVYASTASEVQTYTLIEDLLSQRNTVAMPRITDADAGRMEAVVIESLKDLKPSPGPMDILTPRGSKLLSLPADVAVVPGLAFCPATGVRLGFGGGFYDRALAADGGFHVGLSFDVQLAEALPAEPHDQPLHAVVTPDRVHRVLPPS